MVTSQLAIPRRAFGRLAIAAAAAAALAPGGAALAQGLTPAQATELTSTTKGVLQGTPGGAFAYYQLSKWPAGPLRVTLSFQPYVAPESHRVGFAIYQAGAMVASATGQSTGLGDPVTSNQPSVIITPSAAAGPLLIKVFCYSQLLMTYTLSATAASAPSGKPISGPSTLSTSVGGVLPSNSGGAFTSYTVDHPGSEPRTFVLAYGPYDAGYAHRVGLMATQGGTALGTATSLATGLGDPINQDEVRLTVTPTANGGPLTVRIFSYSSFNLTYTLLALPPGTS